MRLDNRLVTDLFNKIKAHVCNGCRTVKASFRFHLFYNML